MAQLWILEYGKDWGSGLAPLLMGDFAVRRFRSLTALRFSLLGESAPDALFLCQPLTEAETDELPIPLATTLLCRHQNPLGYFLAPELDVFDLVKAIKICMHEHRKNQGEGTLTFAGLVFSLEDRKVWAADQPELFEHLSEKEARLLQYLLKAANRSLSVEIMKQKIWRGASVSASSIESQVSRLRKKLLTCSDVSIAFRSDLKHYALSHKREAALF